VTVLLSLLVTTAMVVAATPVRQWSIRPRQPVGRSPSAGARPWRRSHTRRSHASDDDIAEWCERVARNARAGHSLAEAVVRAAADVPAAAAAIQPAVRALSRGRGLAAALSEIDHRTAPASPVGLVVPVFTACAELGGPAAMPLERVAATLHARSAERAERHSNSAQARLSARVLTTVPVGVLALMALAEPTVRSALSSGLGLVCVIAGGALNMAGWYWMRCLIGGVG
jgi:tight adherence protein B